MPPGQAKKWRVGERLPADVVIYEVPAPLVARIGPPPAGYKYVRVGADILMIAIGTSMVVDALSDLSRMR
jgi:Ni/Co efflux regulator RcnB